MNQEIDEIMSELNSIVEAESMGIILIRGKSKFLG